MCFTNRSYDILKWIAQVFLPACGTLYFALSAIWGFPHAEQIVGTITAFDAFLGIILGISASQYNKNGTNESMVEMETELLEKIEHDLDSSKK